MGENGNIRFFNFLDLITGRITFKTIRKSLENQDLVYIRVADREKNICLKSLDDEIELVNYFIEKMNQIDFDEILNIIKENKKADIEASNIPQFSNFSDGTENILNLLQINDGLTFDQVGLYLTEEGKKIGAYKKYGENHSKLCALLDLCYLEKEKNYKVYISELGKRTLNEKDRNELIAKLAIRIPIINYLILNSLEEIKIIEVLNNYLSESTSGRRKSNVKYIISFIKENYNGEIYLKFLENIK